MQLPSSIVEKLRGKCARPFFGSLNIFLPISAMSIISRVVSRVARTASLAASTASYGVSAQVFDRLNRIADALSTGFMSPQVGLCGIPAAPIAYDIPGRCGAASSAENNSLSGLLSGIWFAVPKRKVCTCLLYANAAYVQFYLTGNSKM